MKTKKCAKVTFREGLIAGSALFLAFSTLGCMAGWQDPVITNPEAHRLRIDYLGKGGGKVYFSSSESVFRVYDISTGKKFRIDAEAMCTGAVDYTVTEGTKTWWYLHGNFNFSHSEIYFDDPDLKEEYQGELTIRMYDGATDTFVDDILYEPEHRIRTRNDSVSDERILIDRFYRDYLYDRFSHDAGRKGSGIHWEDPLKPDLQRTWLFQTLNINGVPWFFGYVAPERKAMMDYELLGPYFVLIERDRNRSYTRIWLPTELPTEPVTSGNPPKSRYPFREGKELFVGEKYVFLNTGAELYRLAKSDPKELELVPIPVPGTMLSVEKGGYWLQDQDKPEIFLIDTASGKERKRYKLEPEQYTFLADDGVALWFKTGTRETLRPYLVRVEKESGKVWSEQPMYDWKNRCTAFHFPKGHKYYQGR